MYNWAMVTIYVNTKMEYKNWKNIYASYQTYETQMESKWHAEAWHLSVSVDTFNCGALWLPKDLEESFRYEKVD